MRSQKCLMIFATFAMPLLCSAETWNNVSIVDANCSRKVKDRPDAHTRDCSLQCAKSGFGVVLGDGTFLKFDASGDEQAVTAIKAARSNDHLRATVTGERDGDTIKVTSLKMQ
jgi:hypothetical protein